jgi:hypothetical protein
MSKSTRLGHTGSMSTSKARACKNKSLWFSMFTWIAGHFNQRRHSRELYADQSEPEFPINATRVRRRGPNTARFRDWHSKLNNCKVEANCNYKPNASVLWQYLFLDAIYRCKLWPSYAAWPNERLSKLSNTSIPVNWLAFDTCDVGLRASLKFHRVC